ncbi:MAG: zinc metallopeptidase [Phycisphaera sp.]|nr:zinc metallopeptidase [Phycisphaera sp.]
MNYMLWVFLPATLLAMWAQAKIKRAYAEASQIPARSGVTGAQAAAQIMADAGLNGVAIEPVRGFLSDHYDPRQKVLRLSPEVYEGRSLAALGIAAHESGHALQDAKGYTPLVLRNGLVPMASLGSRMAFIVLFIGFILQSAGLMWTGVILFAGIVLFQLVNLPCEFDASSRARAELTRLGLVTGDEDIVVGRVLNAAAMTYVAAVIGALLQLMWFIMQANRR